MKLGRHPSGFSLISLSGKILILTLALFSLSGCHGPQIRPDPVKAQPKEKALLSPVLATKEVRSSPLGGRASPEAYHRFLRARLYSLKGNGRRAIEELKLALVHDDGSPYLETALAREYRRLGRLELALEACERALRLEPDFAEAHLEVGLIFRDQESEEKALEAFERGVSLDPQMERAHLALAGLLVKLERWEEAEGALRRMSVALPESLEARMGLGELLLKRKAFGLALEAYRDAVDIRPGSVEGWWRIATIHETLGHRLEAIEAYRSCLDYVGDNLDLYLNLLRLYLLQGDRAMVRHYEGQIAEDGASQSLVKLGKVYLDVKHPEEARRVFDLALRIKEAGQTRYLLGVALMDLGRLREAGLAMGAVPESSDLSDQALLVQSAIAHLADQPQEAERLKALGLATKKDQKERPELFLFLADVYERLKRVDLAVEVLKQAQGDFPDDVPLRYALASMLEKRGDVVQAMAILREILAMSPQHAGALNFLGYTLAERGERLEEAEELIRKALIETPLDGYVTDSLGWVIYKKGRYQEALEVLLKANDLAPAEPVILQHLGECYIKLQRPQEAIKALREALLHRPGAKEKGTIVSRLKELEGRRGR